MCAALRIFGAFGGPSCYIARHFEVLFALAMVIYGAERASDSQCCAGLIGMENIICAGTGRV